MLMHVASSVCKEMFNLVLNPISFRYLLHHHNYSDNRNATESFRSTPLAPDMNVKNCIVPI